MKSFDVDSVVKLGTTIGTGSLWVISLLALDLYIGLPYSERAAFVVLVVVLAIINIASTTIASFTAKYTFKPKDSKNSSSSSVLVTKVEDTKNAMTHTWRYM